jgi:hypothetical protein
LRTATILWTVVNAAPGATLQLKTNPGDEMANYDDATGLTTYDSGITYDAVLPPQPTRRMPKVKVKLNLKDKPDSDLLTFAQQHEAAMTGNASFTTPLPAATVFTPVRAAFATALGSFNTAQQAAKQATTVKDAARAALEDLLTQRGNYVELTAAGMANSAAVVESAGFGVKAAGGATQVPDMVQNLSITAGDNAGELDLQWDPARGARTYDIQLSPDPITATSWTAQPSVTKSKAVVMGLTSGAKMWARVRAVGPGGIGAWSDPATKIVP